MSKCEVHDEYDPYCSQCTYLMLDELNELKELLALCEKELLAETGFIFQSSNLSKAIQKALGK